MDSTAPEPHTESLEQRFADSVGYGTLGHLLGVIVNDREAIDGNREQFVRWAEQHADQLWDTTVGPALDQIEDAYAHHRAETGCGSPAGIKIGDDPGSSPPGAQSDA